MTKQTALERHMNMHQNPPAPFNPEYSPRIVAATERREKRYQNYMNSLSDSIPDAEFDRLCNEFHKKDYADYLKECDEIRASGIK